MMFAVEYEMDQSEARIKTDVSISISSGLCDIKSYGSDVLLCDTLPRRLSVWWGV